MFQRVPLRWAEITIVITLTVISVGCSSTEPVSSVRSIPPGISLQVKDLADQAFSDPSLSEFQKAVLSDYVVTDAEADEAKDRYIQCMSDHGWIASIDGNWQTTVYAAPGSGNEDRNANDSNDLCMAGSLDWVEPIYLEQKNNPEGLIFAQQIRDCFAKNGVPDGNGLSDDQIEQMAMHPNADLHPESAQAYLCTVDPMGSQGISVAIAQQMFDEQSKQWDMAQPSGSPS